MRVRKGIIAGSLLWAFWGADAEAQTIEVAKETQISSDEVRLADIARIHPYSPELAGLPLGRAPYAGHYRWVSRSEIEGALRRWGQSESGFRLEMPDRVLVTRKSRLVPPSLVEEEVIRMFESRPGYRVRVERVEFSKTIAVPEGDLQVRIQPPAALTNLNGVSLKADILVDGILRRSQWVRVKLSLEMAVVVPIRDLPAGHIVRKEDLRLVERRLQRAGNYFQDLAAVVGRATLRRLVAETPVLHRDVRRPKVVKRGDMVTLTARGRSFTVSATARAKAGGVVGELIAVENLATKQVVQARISGEKAVEVIIPGANR